MKDRGTAVLDALPGFPADGIDEITRLIAELPEDSSCIASGSLVEGIGNANSDIDLYIVRGTDDRAAQSTSIGIRATRYVDCEYLGAGAIPLLESRLARSDWPTLAATSLKQIDRYYRLAIGIPVVATEQTRLELSRLSRERACEAFRDWALLRGYEHLGRAAVAHRLGNPGHASLLNREAVLWNAASVLAGLGEGYPALKWTTVKAARRLGEDSAAYRDLLQGFLRPGPDLGDDIERTRRRVVLPGPATAAFDARLWELAPGARLIDDGGATFLACGRGPIVRLDGVLVPLVSALREVPWREAVRRTAERLALPERELLAAVHTPMRELLGLGCVHGRDGKALDPHAAEE